MAITIRHVKPVTDEEILELSRRNPGYQFERTAAGELVVTPTGSEGGRREAQLIFQLGRWAEGDGRGLVFSSSAGFRLPDDALVSPDASWVRRDRWDTLTPEERRGFAPLCPDAVFEILSESEALRDLREKMRSYVASGARLGVLVVPQGRTVEVYRPERAAPVLVDPRQVALDPELPGFVLDAVRIFEH